MRKFKVFCVAVLLVVFSMCNGWAQAQEATSPSQAPAPIERAPAESPTAGPQGAAPAPAYDKAIFLKPIPSDQLAFLSQFLGVPSGVAIKDKQLHKLMNSATPDVMFHYGKDMPLSFALEIVLKDSKEPVLVRDGRYVLITGGNGPYLAGRGLLWIDMKDGIVLGGFYFHPTNGEPTPSVTVYSKQVKEEMIGMSQLPPAFAEDLNLWAQAMRVPPIETRYFIGDEKKKILLEHDEEYCAPLAGPAASDCQKMDADAADADMVAASYLEQTHYATNATAWMISDADQEAWLKVRDHACGIGPDPLGCHIRMTHERTRVIMHRSSGGGGHSGGGHGSGHR